MFQTFTGSEYLKIDIANSFGLDKENWDDRIEWFNSNESLLHSKIKQAETPAMFYAGILAWEKFKHGQPSGYPVSLDATSSGIQFLSCLTGDRKAAELCNIVDTGKREDAYTKLYQIMLEQVGESAKIDRKDTKNAIMTSFYNSTAVPKRIFGEGALLETFFETMRANAPGAWELTETMLALWNPEALSHNWVMPDNFHVKVKVMSTITETVNFLHEPFEVNYAVNQPSQNGRSLGANSTHSIDGMGVREVERRCNYNPNQIKNILKIYDRQPYNRFHEETHNVKMTKILNEHYQDSGFLSARILNYIDENSWVHTNEVAVKNLIKGLPKTPFKILAVHDCFRCLPNYANDLRMQYNILLSDIAKSNLLSFIISQIVGRIIPVNKIDPNLWKDILDTNYALS